MSSLSPERFTLCTLFRVVVSVALAVSWSNCLSFLVSASYHWSAEFPRSFDRVRAERFLFLHRWGMYEYVLLGLVFDSYVDVSTDDHVSSGIVVAIQTQDHYMFRTCSLLVSSFTQTCSGSKVIST